jgi:hypothetical protein
MPRFGRPFQLAGLAILMTPALPSIVLVSRTFYPLDILCPKSPVALCVVVALLTAY